jgi:hypothetical protein
VFLSAGIVVVGVTAVALALDCLINSPESLRDIALLPTIGIALGAGVVGGGAAAVVLTRCHQHPTLWRAVAVGVAVVCAAIALVLTLLAAAWVLSQLGERSGPPPSRGAAYLTMVVVVAFVVVLVFAFVLLALKIAKTRLTVSTISKLGPLGIAAATALVLSLALGLRAEPTSPEPASAKAARAQFVTLYGRIAGQSGAYLEEATRYRPEMLFDSDEKRRPIDVDAFLADRQPSGRPVQQFCEVVCMGLDQPNKLAAAGPASTLHLSTGGRDLPTRMYYDRTVASGKTYLDYWVFYSFNDSPALPSLMCLAGLGIANATCFDHEGDWEGVTVILDSAHSPPERVVYATHDGTALFGWKALAAVGGTDGVHPRVFVARGSHASYTMPCGPRGSCHQLGSDLPDGQRDGTRPWAGNARCSECLAPFPMSASGAPLRWAAFQGRWGQARCTVGLKVCSRSEGPKSPFYQSRYTKPWGAPPSDDRLVSLQKAEG